MSPDISSLIRGVMFFHKNVLLKAHNTRNMTPIADASTASSVLTGAQLLAPGRHFLLIVIVSQDRSTIAFRRSFSGGQVT